MSVLLGCDLGTGEGAETALSLLALADLASVSCAPGACGEASTRVVMHTAIERGVRTGIRLSWPDDGRAGCIACKIDPDSLRLALATQTGLFREMLGPTGGPPGHVKLSEVLSRLCDDRGDLAEACVDWMEAELEGVPLVVAAGGLLHAVAEARGVPLLREICAGRGYADEACLLPRGEVGSLITDPEQAAERIRAWKATGYLPVGSGNMWLVEAETVCVQADAPGSVELARAVRAVLG